MLKWIKKSWTSEIWANYWSRGWSRGFEKLRHVVFLKITWWLFYLCIFDIFWRNHVNIIFCLILRFLIKMLILLIDDKYILHFNTIQCYLLFECKWSCARWYRKKKSNSKMSLKFIFLAIYLRQRFLNYLLW